MVQASSGRKNYLHKFLVTVGFIVFLFLIFTASWKYFEKQAERDYSNVEPNEFPVVLMTPGRSQIIILDSLKTYQQKDPVYSFLVPDGKEELINRQLKESQKERGAKGIPEIRVTRLGDGRQQIELEISTDGFFLARYEATDKEVRPLTFKSSGPLFPIFPCGATFFFGFVGFYLLRLVLWLIKRKRTLN